MYGKFFNRSAGNLDHVIWMKLNEHRRTLDNPNSKSKATTVAEHFLSSSTHPHKGMQLCLCKRNLS